MNAQHNTMAPPLQQVPVAPAQQTHTQHHAQSQIPPHLLPQYHAHMPAMQDAGLGGLVTSQPRSLGVQVPTTADPGRAAAGGGSPLLITSSGLASGGFPNAIGMSGYLHPKHAGSSLMPLGSAPHFNSNYVLYHSVPQAGDGGVSLGANVQAAAGAHSSLGALSSSLLSAKPSNLEAGREATQRNSSVSMQQMHQLTQPHTPSPDLLSGGAGEGPVPGQPVRPSLGFGFSRHQLTILRNQILAFKRLKARKGGEHLISDEIKRLINPPFRPPHHSGQTGGTSRSNDHQGLGAVAMIKVSQPVAKVGYDSHASVQEIDVKLQERPVTREAQAFRPVERREGETQVRMVTSTSALHPVNNGDGQDDINVKQAVRVPTQLKREPGLLLEGSTKAQVSESRTTNMDTGIQIGSSSNVSVLNAKSEVPAVSTIQKSRQVVRPYRGPLFGFPPVSKRMDGAALSLTPQASTWGHPIALGYKVRELLLEEGLRIIDKKRAKKLKIIEDSLATDKRKKALQPDQVVKLRIEEKKLGLMELQVRIRDEVEEQQQEIMAMGERAYRKFVRLCERQHTDMARQVMMLQRSTREKHLKALSQWRKKLLEAQWASRDARITRNRGVAKYHERMLREFSKKKDEDRNKRMEALKNNDVDAYKEMLRQQQSQLPGAAGERFEVLSSFLTQTEEYLHKLGGKISAVKNHQEREEAALAAAAAARAQGYSEEEAEEAAVRAGEEVSINGYINKNSQDASVNKYYSLAHAVHEQILKQPSMLRVGTLRDYQLVGLQWMLSLYNNRLNGILADEMGLGKTVQVMALIAYLMEFKGNYGPHLIIVPNAVIVNWKSELLRWLPSVSCIYYVGHKDQRAKIFSQDVCAMKFNVLVTTYEFIMRDRSKLSKVEWKYMIIDEAQRMKDRESRLARDLDRFRCQRRLLLTGTPLQNDLHELWSLLNLLLPEVFDNSKSFHEWFAKPFQKDTAQTTDEDDWLETEKKVIVIHRLHQILEPFMLRRRVEDVEGSLPPKVSVVLKCKMSAYQAAIYDWVKVTGTIRLDPDDEAQRIAGNSKRLARAYAPLQNKCMELRKVCNHPYLNYPPRFHLLGDNTVRMCGKLWILDRTLVKLHKSGHRVLLFSTMTKLLDILEDYLQWRKLSYRRIDGTTSLDARESAIVEFNRPGSESFIFLLSIRAAGRGLNLQTADTVVVYDPDPNPKNEEQAVARAHRIGQTREVRVIYLEAVVESVPSYEKEDELRSGGTLDEDDDEMAGKDRYVGSVESLVRNNIQQHKIDMADEVINAGRFDQRTTQEERRLTLEALLHDEERYQQTVHDVPTLQEVNRMIARTDEEVQLFDQMDEEYNWAGDLIPHLKVPKWLRVGSREVHAAVEATSKETMKKGFVGAVGTREAEERLFAPGTSAIVLGKRSKSLSKYKVEEVDEEEFEEEEREAVIEEALIAADADDEEEGEEEEEEGEINAGIVEDEAMMDAEDGEEPAEEEEVIFEEVIEEVVEEEDEEEEVEEEVALVLKASYEGEMSPVKSRRVATATQSKKFASLSALEARRTGSEESDDLEEGEIAASGGSEQQSESWMMEREEVGVDVKEDQVFQPQKKRKRSNSHQRPTTQLDRLGERENSNGPFSERETIPIFSLRLNTKVEQRPVPWSNFPGDDAVAQMYDRSENWGVHAKKRHMNPPEVQAPVRPRIVFKHSWANGSQEPAAEQNIGRGRRTAKLVHPSTKGSWVTADGRLPESLQKKCKAVLGKLHGAVNKDGREIAALFLELPKRRELPDYYKVIARPINAHLIEERLDRFEYPSVLEFATDVHLMFDNAARFHRNIPEVQADARRLHALFEQRMGLMFPEVDFSSVRARGNMGALPRKPPSVTGARGIRRPAPIDSEPARASQAETPSSRSLTRGMLIRTAPPQEEPVSGSTKVKGKKSKKPGNEKVREKKSKSKSKSKMRSSVKDRESVEEAEPDGGILHPVDLVIHKKKRKGREYTGNRTGRSHLGLDSEEPREATARNSPLDASGKSRSSEGTPGWGQFAGPATGRRSGLRPDPKVGAVTVLKKSRTDGGKRRPSHT